MWTIARQFVMELGATSGVLLIVVSAAAWPAWRASRLDQTPTSHDR
jgi:hypothetical protein